MNSAPTTSSTAVWARAAHAVFLVCTGLWVGTVTMSGLFAAIIFPATKSLAPTFPNLAIPADEHWTLVAGIIAEQMFTVTGLIQLALATLALLSLVARSLTAPSTLRNLAALTSGLACLIATLALLYLTLSLMPEMNALLRDYRTLAKTDPAASTSTAKLAFDRLHPTASNLLALISITTFVSFVAAACTRLPK